MVYKISSRFWFDGRDLFFREILGPRDKWIGVLNVCPTFDNAPISRPTKEKAYYGT